MNNALHSPRLALSAVHRAPAHKASRLLAFLGRLFCHERGGAVLCASPGATVLYRAS
ncbi:hypothetical protein [Pseudomonas oryzihabitans]|uniref:hypothetical protein n=1 Tax=Pseudomonas oryzihabitans TaxID=47885 RepID=UPI00142F0C82|nr:hypothetical protein [Pseudomonas psychrotolerans]